MPSNGLISILLTEHSLLWDTDHPEGQSGVFIPHADNEGVLFPLTVCALLVKRQREILGGQRVIDEFTRGTLNAFHHAYVKIDHADECKPFL